MNRFFSSIIEYLRNFINENTPAELYVFFALFLEKIGKIELAGNFLYKVAEEGWCPEPNFYFWNNLGVYALWIYKHSGDEKALEVAEKAFISAAALDPANPLLKRNDQNFHQLREKHNELTQTLFRLLGAPDKDGQINIQIAITFARLGRYEDAEKHFNEAGRISIDFVPAVLYRIAYSWFLPLVRRQKESLAMQEEILVAIANHYTSFEEAQGLLNQAEEELMKLWPERFPQGLGDGLSARLKRQFEQKDELDSGLDESVDRESEPEENPKNFWSSIDLLNRLGLRVQAILASIIAYNESLWQNKDENLQKYWRLFFSALMISAFILLVIFLIWLIASFIAYLNDHPLYFYVH